jgi:dihydrofolate synthase/folylpolyglutamate synthase
MPGDYEFKDVDQAVGWINGLRYAGEKNGLENARLLLGLLGNPERTLRFAHVAGTNGKGSVCAMLERMLRANGYRTGMYTSPYLMRFPERFRVDGIPIGDLTLARIAGRVRAATEALYARGVRPTMFELCTAVAFIYFAESKVDIAVIEVGMGGRLDSTNIIQPDISVITAISLDHVKALGCTNEQIALEKAGVIKPGIPVVIGRQLPAIRAVLHGVCAVNRAPLIDAAREEVTIKREHGRGAEFICGGMRAEISMPGRHQIDNAALALCGILTLKSIGWKIGLSESLSGLKAARWPGRLEWLDEGLIIDGAHNPNGAKALTAYVKAHLSGRKTALVVGMMRDKHIDACAEAFASFADEAVATQVEYSRAADADIVQRALSAYGAHAVTERDIATAVEKARALAGHSGVVIACGSIYLAGAIRLLYRDDGGAL